MQTCICEWKEKLSCDDWSDAIMSLLSTWMADCLPVAAIVGFLFHVFLQNEIILSRQYFGMIDNFWIIEKLSLSSFDVKKFLRFDLFEFQNVDWEKVMHFLW